MSRFGNCRSFFFVPLTNKLCLFNNLRLAWHGIVAFGVPLPIAVGVCVGAREGASVKNGRLIVLLGAAALFIPSVLGQHNPTESEAKARFLANAPVFVEWPAAVFAGPNTPLLICVHGDFSFGTALAEITRAVLVKGRRLEVKWVRGEQSLAGCQVLFVTRSMAKSYGKVLQTVKDESALTIGEDAEFLRAGGMLALEPNGRSLAFDVNIDAVAREHLKISSQLLSLARQVIHDAEFAKS